MPTPKSGYFNLAGNKIPGTTTIIGRFKESGALINWAYNQGKQGIPLYESRDKAADVGTVAHHAVEMSLKGENINVIRKSVRESLPDRKMQEQAMSAYNAFRKWWQLNKFIVVASEVAIISEKHQFGGTLDALAKDKLSDEIVLLDWKTSNGIYTDHIVQLAAYRLLLKEKYGKEKISNTAHLIRFGKDHGDFHHHSFDSLDDAEAQFLLFRKAYDLDKELKKRV